MSQDKYKRAEKERKKTKMANYTYILGLPILVILIVLLIFVEVKIRLTQDNSKNPNPQTTESQGTINRNDTDKMTIEEIINGSIDKVIEENNIETSSNDSKLIDSNLTLSELLGLNKEKEDGQSYLEKDLGIKYFTGTYQGITKDGAIAIKIDKETKYIYLIGVSNIDTDRVSALLSKYDNIYVEYDIVRKKGDGEQAYIWIDVPDNSHKENMVNVIALENAWGTYVDPSPNINYTYYFLKIKA